MFTGIVEEIGSIREIRKGARSAVLTVQGSKVLEDLHLGDSVAVNGVCLTVTRIYGGTFMADVMNETISRSTLGSVTVGSSVNLERAMAANGRFGGHMVSGHIDGTGVIEKIQKDDNAIWFTVKTDQKIMHYIVEKGSVAMEGISLTVAKVTENSFSVSIIPHTIQETTLAQKKAGDLVNIENDITGKYIEKFLHAEQEKKPESGITKEFLMKLGY